MEAEQAWKQFIKTGAVADYLRYKRSRAAGEETHEAADRRAGAQDDGHGRE